MRVAVVTPYAFESPGGVQDQVARIVGWLREDGHEAWAVAPGSGGPEGTRHVGGFVSWRANRSRAPVALNPAVVRRVGRAVADADVVHIHEPFMPMVSLGAVLADTPPKVGTFHADPGGLVRRLYRGTGPLLRRLARRLTVATAVSETAAGPLPLRERPRIVPNGIDLAPYQGEAERVRGRVLFVGRDEPRKGLDVLLDAWPSVLADHPGATLHVVGVDRPDAVLGASFGGRVTEEQKVAELQAAEVLVAPNLGGESFGIVVLEALAAGCAVVASDLGAFVAVAGDAAEYVPVGDEVALARGIRAVLADPERLSDLSASAVARSTRFGREAVMGGYLGAYERALD